MITGFGRLGAPFGAQHFGVVPDMITMAKGLTNGAIPMGAVAASKEIYDAFMHGPDGAIELFHGYTYSAHPIACAAGLATQQVYRDEGLLTRAAEIGGYWADAVHSLKGLPHVIDLRNLGLIGAIELEPHPGQAGRARLRRVRACLREGAAGARDGRHHRAVAAADHRAQHVDELVGKLADDAARSAAWAARGGAGHCAPDAAQENARPPRGDRASISTPRSDGRRGRHSSPSVHGNVVETGRSRAPSLLNTSSGVPSTRS